MPKHNLDSISAAVWRVENILVGVKLNNLATKAAFYEYASSLKLNIPLGSGALIISGSCLPCLTLWKGQCSLLYQLFCRLFLAICWVLHGLLLHQAMGISTDLANKECMV